MAISSIWNVLLGWNQIPPTLRDQIAALREDPGHMLQERPLVIGRMRLLPAFVMTLLVGAAFGWYVAQRADQNPWWWISGMVIMFGVIGYGSLEKYIHEVELHPDGVRFANRLEELWCPWEVFDVGGIASSEIGAVVIPFNPAALARVEHLRGDELTTGELKGRFLSVRGSSSVCLRLYCELHPINVGTLLLETGRRLGLGSDPEEAELHRQVSDVLSQTLVSFDEYGWLVVDINRLAFPASCCICGSDTHRSTRVDAIERQFGFRESLEYWFDIPVCRACEWRWTAWEWLGRLIVVVSTGGPVAFLLASVFPQVFENMWRGDYSFLVLAGIFWLPLAWIFLRYGRELVSPVKMAFESDANHLKLWFRQSGYCQQVAEESREQI